MSRTVSNTMAASMIVVPRVSGVLFGIFPCSLPPTLFLAEGQKGIGRE